MVLRKEIEPDFQTAEKRYPEVLKLILAYSDYCEENGDEDNTEYQKLENRLHEMTGKDMSPFNLWNGGKKKVLRFWHSEYHFLLRKLLSKSQRMN